MPNSYHDIIYTNQTSVSFTNTDLKYLETAHLTVVAANTSSGDSVTFTGTSSPGFTTSVISGTTTLDLSAITSSFPAGTNRIRIQRVTPSTNLLTNFVNSSLLRAEDLNQNSEQLLFVLQEQLDAGTGSLPLTATDEYDAGNRNIINLKDGASDKDAVTLGQVSAFVAGISNAPSVPQVYSFQLGTASTGTEVGSDTTFTLNPAPSSNVDGTFIVELAGVIQHPTVDFTVAGNILTILGRTDLDTSGFNGTKLIVQNFGLSRNVFNFPATGEAANNTETPLTLKGAASGDNTAMLKVTDSSNNENTSISAGGTLKAKVIEPITSSTLAVNPTTVTTTGAVISGGDLTVGSGFSVTQSTGDVTANKVTISAGSPETFESNLAVPKSYVDSNGGLSGAGLAPDQDLNLLVTPQRVTGVIPGDPAAKNYPSGVTSGEKVILLVNRLGGTSSTVISQELLVFSSLIQLTFKYIRMFDGTSFTEWYFDIQSSHSLNNLSAATGDYSMGSNKIINVSDPSSAQDASTKAYVDSQKTRKVLGTWVGDGGGVLSDAEFTPAEGDSFMNYQKLELEFEHVGRKASGWPTNTLFRDSLISLGLYQSNPDSTGTFVPGFDRMGYGAGSPGRFGYEVQDSGTYQWNSNSANYGETLRLAVFSHEPTGVGEDAHFYGSVCIYPNYVWERFNTVGQYVVMAAHWQLFNDGGNLTRVGPDGSTVFNPPNTTIANRRTRWYTNTDGVWPTAAPSLDKMVLRFQSMAITGTPRTLNEHLQFTDGKITLYGYTHQ
tara:strand:- start:523 stop:2853 length:2331 start_codon:yes stop_codon:yes gene_type:complete